MVRFITIILLSAPLFLSGQSDKSSGIYFEKNLSWSQLLAKAKRENKYIFVDCFATWCEPCKYMDKSVYTTEDVGNYANDRFVAVKVQMDSSKRDAENIRAWYADARLIRDKYDIHVFPSYLFFSPDGRIVHRDAGAKASKSFLELLRNATLPEKQYYSLIVNYREGRKNFHDLPYLTKIAKGIGDNQVAETIANDYINNYLMALPPERLYERENIAFIASYRNLLSSKGKTFRLFYDNSHLVDSAMHLKDYSDIYVRYIITKEEIIPLVELAKKQGKEPSWKKIKKSIKIKYRADYAQTTILDAQINWYKEKKDWPKLVKLIIEKYEGRNIDTTVQGWAKLNDVVYTVIFKHSADKAALKKGLLWIDKVMEERPDTPEIIDTRASLLYKLGQTEEAIKWEEKADSIERESALKQKREIDTTYTETIEKMKKGEKTWDNN